MGQVHMLEVVMTSLVETCQSRMEEGSIVNYWGLHCQEWAKGLGGRD